jgi:hypothetical protein
MQPEDLTRRSVEIGGWGVVIETYRLGERYYSTVSSAEAGARFARSEGPTRDWDESLATEKATRYLGETRRFPTR